MKKSNTMTVRISDNELEKLKLAAELSNYGSYSEFVRRTALNEAEKILENKGRKKDGGDKK